MGFIFTNKFLVPATITGRTETYPYSALNVSDFWDLYRHFRAADALTDDYLLKLTYKYPVSIKAIFLNDVNFDKVIIHGSDDDITYVNVTGTISIELDETVQRRKVFIPVQATYQYWKLYIPTTASITDTTPVWRVGTVAMISDYIELNMNPSFGYSIKVSKPYIDLKKASGSKGRISLGDKLVWSIKLPFESRDNSNESELWAINSLDNSTPCLLYENLGDTSKAYICVRDSDFEITYKSANIISSSIIKFTELV